MTMLSSTVNIPCFRFCITIKTFLTTVLPLVRQSKDEVLSIQLWCAPILWLLFCDFNPLGDRYSHVWYTTRTEICLSFIRITILCRSLTLKNYRSLEFCCTGCLCTYSHNNELGMIGNLSKILFFRYFSDSSDLLLCGQILKMMTQFKESVISYVM